MRGGGGSGRRRAASASFGGNAASTRSNVRAAARGLVSALENLPGASGPELLRHLPAVMHLLLSLVAAPPASVAQAVAADAAEAAALRAAKAAADEAARVAEAALERAAALGAAVNEAAVPPTPYHTPHPARHSDRGNDSPRDDSPTDHSDPPSSTKMSASKSPSASSAPVTPETPPFAVSQHKRSASTRSTASSSASSDVSSLHPNATKKAKGHVEDGLRERAFACLVRVAARVQAFLGPDDAGECTPWRRSRRGCSTTPSAPRGGATRRAPWWTRPGRTTCPTRPMEREHRRRRGRRGQAAADVPAARGALRVGPSRMGRARRRGCARGELVRVEARGTQRGAPRAPRVPAPGVRGYLPNARVHRAPEKTPEADLRRRRLRPPEFAAAPPVPARPTRTTRSFYPCETSRTPSARNWRDPRNDPRLPG